MRLSACCHLPLILFFLLLSTIAASSQTWTYRAGYGTAAGNESALGTCADSLGNVYVTGYLTGSTINFGTGPLVSAGAADGFVAKFDSAGTCLWSIRFGGTGADQGNTIATNGTEVFVAGSFTSAMTVGTSPTNYFGIGAGIDGIVLKLSASSGNLASFNVFGGPGKDEVKSICIDSAARMYITGTFQSSLTGPARFGPFTRTVNGNASGLTSDLFVARISATGVFDWVSSGGTSGTVSGSSDNGSSICYIPGLNEVMITGSFGNGNATYATVSPASSVSLTNTGQLDCLLLEINASNGSFISGLSSSTPAAGRNEEGLAISYDNDRKVVCFAGYFNSDSTNFGTLKIKNLGNATDDIFFGRYDPVSNSFDWIRSAGSAAGSDRALAVAISKAGIVYIAGTFVGTASFSTIVPSNSNTPVASTVSITNTRITGDDLFLGKFSISNGASIALFRGSGDNSSTLGVAPAALCFNQRQVWIAGNYGNNVLFNVAVPASSLPVLAGQSTTSTDIVLATLRDTLPNTLSVSGTQTDDDFVCAGSSLLCNGRLTATASGGYPPYAYTWNDTYSRTPFTAILLPHFLVFAVHPLHRLVCRRRS